MTDEDRSPTWNPKGLPEEKIGKCENEDHEEWSDEKPKKERVYLMMTYADDSEFEIFEKAKFQPNTEHYWCEGCKEQTY